jgi:hypothetical protein
MALQGLRLKENTARGAIDAVFRLPMIYILRKARLLKIKKSLGDWRVQREWEAARHQ